MLTNSGKPNIEDCDRATARSASPLLADIAGPAPTRPFCAKKAIIWAHRWRQMLESAKCGSSAELAKTEKVNASYLSLRTGHPAQDFFGDRAAAA